MLKRHSIPLLSSCALTSACRKSVRISFSAPLNVLALSNTIKAGVPPRAVNFLRHLSNVGVERSSTKSKCSARVTQHENKET